MIDPILAVMETGTPTQMDLFLIVGPVIGVLWILGKVFPQKSCRNDIRRHELEQTAGLDLSESKEYKKVSSPTWR